MSVAVGAKAPDFTLPNQDREPVTLSEQLKKGPVVLAFMPAAFSGTCTTEMCTFRDSASELNKVNATVLGVTVDTFFALKAWGEVQNVRFAGSVAGNRWRSYEVKPQFLRGSARETVELRWDLYQVWHERGTSEWRIALDRNGRVWCANVGSAPARWQVSVTGR